MNDKTAHVRRLVAARLFPDALYFGALCLTHETSAELHMLLGVACCGCCLPIAEAQRMLNNVPVASAGRGLLVGNATLLVHEGFQHLAEALRREPDLEVSADFAPVVRQVGDDLSWYLREDFKGFRIGRQHTLRDAAMGAAALLGRLLRSPPALPDAWMRDVAETLADEEIRAPSLDASFYGIMRKDLP